MLQYFYEFRFDSKLEKSRRATFSACLQLYISYIPGACYYKEEVRVGIAFCFFVFLIFSIHTIFGK